MSALPRQRQPLPLPQLVGTDVRLLDRRTGWIVEQKWDGWRGILDAGSGRLVSRHGTELGAAFPEIIDAAGELGDVVLDGEIVCLTAGRPDFERVSARGLVCSPRAAARAALTASAVLIVWDVLRQDARDLRALPLRERRRILESLGLGLDPAAKPIALTTVYDDVAVLLQVTFELGLEGVVAKMPGARYRSGVRSTDWIKVKHAFHRDVSSARRSWRRSG
jgi:bifunctional non-homologous end joining protein LigD